MRRECYVVVGLMVALLLVGCRKFKEEKKPEFGAVPTKIEYRGIGDRVGENLTLQMAYREQNGKQILTGVEAQAQWKESAESKSTEWSYVVRVSDDGVFIELQGTEHEVLLPTGQVLQWNYDMPFYGDGMGKKLGYHKARPVWYEEVKGQDSVRESYYYDEMGRLERTVRQKTGIDQGSTGGIARRQFEVSTIHEGNTTHPYDAVALLSLMPVRRLGVDRMLHHAQMIKTIREQEVRYFRYDTIWQEARTSLPGTPAVDRFRATKVEYRDDGLPIRLMVHWKPEGKETEPAIVDEVNIMYNR